MPVSTHGQVLVFCAFTKDRMTEKKDNNLLLHLGNLLHDAEGWVKTNEADGAHQGDVVIRGKGSLLDAAEALTLALAADLGDLEAVLAADKAELADVAFSSLKLHGVGRGGHLAACLVLCSFSIDKK